MAFVTSAVLAGAAGALYAMNYSSIAAKKFDFNTSILILVMLATNNPTLKGFFSRLFHRERADAPHAAAVKGGGRQ